MKDLTPKFNNTAGPTGKLTADEFNDSANETQTAIVESGQTLTVGVGDDNRQLLKAIAAGGKRITRTNGQTALLGEIVIPNNSASPLTINLPNTGLFVGGTIFFEQEVDDLYSVNALTIGRSSNNIMGFAENFVMNSALSDNSLISVTWVAGSIGWKLINLGVIGSTL